MYDALTIARYIVNYSNQKNDPWFSNLKLQKLLYFCQAYFLLTTERPCFGDAIEAWDFGPVVPNVYHEFKRFGAGWIPTTFDETVIDKKTRTLIDDVVDNFKDYDNVALTTLVHAQDPWIHASRSSRGKTITDGMLLSYFSN